MLTQNSFSLLRMRKLWSCSQLLWLTTRCQVLAFSPHANSGPKVARSFSSTTRCQATNLIFESSWEEGKALQECNATMIVGKKAALQNLVPQLLHPLGLSDCTPSVIIKTLIDAVKEKTGGSSSTMVVTGDEHVHRLMVAGLPSKLSRHNHPMAVHTLTRLVGPAAKGDHSRLVVLTDDFSIGPLAMAIAKGFPQFSMKSGDDNEKVKNVHITFVKSDGSVVNDPIQLHAAKVAVKGVQLASRLVDSHPELLTTSEFSKQVKALVDKHPKVHMTEIIGKELFARGYGGLYAVGKGANCPPRMIILKYDGADGAEDSETVALVGKGIVYDTGGLSLKSKDGMTGMKHDMGGSAGMVGGFFSAVELEVKKNITCILCLAENAIGPDAFRNDGNEIQIVTEATATLAN